ncbi:[protein-PII] uridylyltransferase [Roseospira visakhapatnamensis]|uniref:Bifunctional uridylyltransferase/uridylyl-removing enzyme n=1 Tax=Roseospira visakhapatnamensis TaxID=390880 RepID=A0A7W6W9N5_9PROT|nr:[protein-PII] uridylyltransferase [Roseospira visakhapatnamensis]MBB4266074.1 [protein-PII] uridylyltransferase [Roseospira visakhapatnamensis]
MSLPRPASPRAIIHRKALTTRLNQVAIAAREAGRPVRAPVLEVLKEALAEGRAEVRRRFLDQEGSGAAVCAGNTYLFDQLLRTLHDVVVTHQVPKQTRTTGEKVAVLALGGYGRGEMMPYSDIDLLFVLPYRATPYSEQVVESMLYVLWDLGLKVGHATRSVDECLRQARADMTIRTSLLEARYIWGEPDLFEALKGRLYTKVIAGTGTEFLEAKLAERNQRHERLGDSRYVLEPNVKEGKGGLRDLHTLFWIARYLYQVSDVDDLVGLGVLTETAARTFTRARAFLWTVRCHLHYLGDRAEERITFDVQTPIAERMGYRDRPGARGVERFMKHYFLVARDVGTLTRIFLAVLEEQQKRRPLMTLAGLGARRRHLKGFVLDNGRLAVPGAETFATDPRAMLRLFLVAHDQGLSIHPDTLRQVTEALARVKTLRDDPAANAMFLDMLTHRKDPDVLLRGLSEAGVFGRFIPDFGRVTAQMQYDMYHVYTTDEHTVRAIGLLSRIESGALRDRLPVASDAVQTVQSRRALYVAVLLHDIAKGRDGDHSVLGAEIAVTLCPRLGLDEEETETVSWLVRHHLDMSRVAFRRDVDDPRTIANFADLVQSPERLKLLLVLTCADIMAVGPGIWNNWKAALLRELYYRTDEHLTGGHAAEAQDLRVARRKDALREVLTDLPAARVEAFLGLGYPGYWLTFDTETHARHARVVVAAEDAARPGAEALALETRVDTARGVTEVLVYATDHAGLFRDIAGAMALAGASIVDAKIYTLNNGMALDTFTVQSAEGKVLDQPARLARLKATVERVMLGSVDLRAELARKAPRLPARTEGFQVPPRVLFHLDASTTHTVIEVNGRDRSGFLYSVTDALTDLNLQIASARVNTYGERVVDVFYVKDVFGLQVTHPTKLRQIKMDLMKAITRQALESRRRAPVVREADRARRRAGRAAE